MKNGRITTTPWLCDGNVGYQPHMKDKKDVHLTYLTCIKQKPDSRPIVDPPKPPPLGAIFLLFPSIFEFPFSATGMGKSSRRRFIGFDQ